MISKSLKLKMVYAIQASNESKREKKQFNSTIDTSQTILLLKANRLYCILALH